MTPVAKCMVRSGASHRNQAKAASTQDDGDDSSRPDVLILKLASASRSSGQWSDDDFDVLANGGAVHPIHGYRFEHLQLAWPQDCGIRQTERAHRRGHAFRDPLSSSGGGMG